METHGKSEHERIVELEQRLPELAIAIGDLGGRLEQLAGSFGGSFPVGGGLRPGASAAFGTAAGPLFMFPWWLMAQDTFESVGAAAGRLVDDAKELADAAKRQEDAVGDLGNLNDGDKRKEGREKLAKLASSVSAVLQKGREARREVRAAAVAAKSHKGAREGLRKARESFDEAQRLLDQYQQELAKAKPTEPNLNPLKQLLVDARQKVADDLGHLQDALDAITA